MRLIHTETLELDEYFGDNIPTYAILSHTWGKEEVSYQDWHQVGQRSVKKGYRKILASCHVARDLSIDHIWVDTNCINKENSSELSEAINSMFAWYQRSAICLVYLEDFQYGTDGLANLEDCRYWTRGWTLQELLAPSKMIFLDSTWRLFGTKDSLMLEISKITSIHIQYLMHPDSVPLASIARRMSWAAQRSTTRVEDMAYCLMGIFEVNMPLLYGEGEKAFIRLQEEIIRYSNDQTVFCWSWSPSTRPGAGLSWNGCLAPRPITFRNSTGYLSTFKVGKNITSEFRLTNSGLRIGLPLVKCVLDGYVLAVLNAKDPANYGCQLCICLTESRGLFVRSNVLDRLLSIPMAWITGGEDIYLAHERDPGRKASRIPNLKSVSDTSHGLNTTFQRLVVVHPTMFSDHRHRDCHPNKECIRLQAFVKNQNMPFYPYILHLTTRLPYRIRMNGRSLGKPGPTQTVR
jgi:Heterokaryon incompatibility protein (HET)